MGSAMSHEIPVFYGAIDRSLASPGPIAHDVALNLVPENPWMSTSRNGWYQGLITDLISRYRGLDELRYLTEIAVIVPTEQLAAKIHAIRNLLVTIEQDTEPFVQATPYMGYDADEVREQLLQAEVSRDVDDDSTMAFSNFFSFLVSHLAALQEAQQAGKCLLYVQAQP
jgi:hypothetical protein